MRSIIDAMHLLILGGLVAALCIACISDVRSRRIPNRIVLFVAGLFVPWAILGDANSVVSSLEAALIALLLSGGMYSYRLVGAGDSKLLTVCALFVGLVHLLQFFALIALAGGVLAIVSLSMQPTRALVLFQMRGEGSLDRGVPYGVAIAVATVCVVGLSQSGIAGAPALSWMP